MGWQNGKKIIGLWAINENRNAWVYVQGLGWRKLADNFDSVVINLMTMSAHAKGKESSVNFREDGNMIKEMYVW
ncbi:MAG: hypothetical protein GKC10_03835 [Methanosarcinales archaeon]|nr:hypothetical protein [Methanosarcinales archaeon]NYT01873.1 hypothetical protein [Methanosarcinales archaeon]